MDLLVTIPMVMVIEIEMGINYMNLFQCPMGNLLAVVM